MEERLRQLERTNRWLILALVGLVALQTFQPFAPRREGGAVEVLPRALAGEGFLPVDKAKKPEVIFTTSQSGATLWEYVRQPDGSYVRRGYGS